MCRNTDIHPLAQLSVVGKGMIEAAINNLAISAGFGLLGGSGLVPGGVGASLDSMTGFYGTMASLGLMIGFVLFYVLPFLPFIYFFFAVGGWVKSVFEAMVGVPLWALAHLRIDGQGLPGQAASAGYMLLFEIFVRPIAIVFGLLAAIVIFAAQVKVLNEIFYLAVSNFGRADPDTVLAGGCTVGPASGLGIDVLGQLPGSEVHARDAVDEFFFTIIYAVIVYMMAMASFKLIDLVPGSLVSRWYGSNASSFTDDNEPSRGAENLMKYSTIGGGMIGGQLSEAVSSARESWDEGRQEAGRRSAEAAAAAGGLNQLASGDALPQSVNRERDIMTAMRNDSRLNDPNLSQADRQQHFDDNYRDDLAAARNQQDSITGRVQTGRAALTTQSQATFQRNLTERNTVRSDVDTFLNRSGLTFSQRT
ncbi:MAG: DotA/TraY family protein [Pseudomonadota bacterium]